MKIVIGIAFSLLCLLAGKLISAIIIYVATAIKNYQDKKAALSPSQAFKHNLNKSNSKPNPKSKK